MISALNKLPDGTLELTITIPWKKVEETYRQTLIEMAKKAEFKGFRKGKAPIKLVEGKVGKSAVYEEVLKNLVPQVYTETVGEQKIKPIITPQIKIISLEEKKDWQIQAITCESPEAELGDYQGEIKKLLAADKIWVPGKDKSEKQPPQNSQDQKLQKVFTAILQTSRIQIPAILIQQEVDRLLSRLIDQTGRLGLTVEQYLTSIGKTSQQLRQEYRQQAEESLKLELLLSAIADKQKIEVKEEEIEKLINEVTDEKARKNLESPTEKAYLKQLLRKRTTIDNLLKL